MNSEGIIVLLIIGIVVSKMIIGVLIKYLVSKNILLKREREKLESANLELERNLLKIQEQERELRDAENFKLKIFSIASHDLRTPFNNLKSLLDYIEVAGIQDEHLKTLLLRLKDQSVLSHEMLDNILRWTAGHLRNMDLGATDFQVLEEVTKSTSLFNNELTKKNINLSIAIPASLKAYGNRDVFNFVIRNLTSNAIKYSTERSNIEIGILPDPYENPAAVYVKDYGEGMDRSMIQKIEKGSFGENKEHRQNFQSAGIGLSLCHDLICHAGWRLRIDSEVGKGSKFEILLPLENSDYPE